MEIVQRIKHDEQGCDLLAWKHPTEAIPHGSRLVVNASQQAVFLVDGRIEATFHPGAHTLTTANLPFARRIVNVPFGDKTPFPAEVWFLSLTVRRGLKWGAPSPLTIQDSRFELPLRVRAFGEWGLAVADAEVFLRSVVGTRNQISQAEVEDMFLSDVVQTFASALGGLLVEQGLSLLEAPAHLHVLSLRALDGVNAVLADYGLRASQFAVSSLSLSEADVERLQIIMGRRLELTQYGDSYELVRSFGVLEETAKAGAGAAGSMMGEGLGLGLGLGVAQVAGVRIGQRLDLGGVDKAASSPEERLATLKRLFEQKLITEEEYASKRGDILDKL